MNTSAPNVSKLLLTASKVVLRNNGKDNAAFEILVDPDGCILYWLSRDMINRAREQLHIAHGNVSNNFVFIQDIVDVRMTELNESDTGTVSRKKSSSAGLKKMSIPNSKSFFEVSVVTAENIAAPVFITIVFEQGTQADVSRWVDELFQLSLRTRRLHRGLLYHFKRIIAPVKYIRVQGVDNSAYIDRIAQVLVPNADGVERNRVSRRLRRAQSNNETNIDKFFVKLILEVTQRHNSDLMQIFKTIGDTDGKPMKRQKFLQFLQTYQRNPRHNEDVYPPMKERQMNKMLEQLGYGKDDPITFECFVHYLWSDFCTDINNNFNALNTDLMHRPLCEYFINSSHNTYCSGDQLAWMKLSGKADVEIYRQVLLAGCRCIELDCWDGKNNQPVITHGPQKFVHMNEISLRDVCEAIKEAAFKTSPYPVLLSIENHLTSKQQSVMVETFKDVFGEQLLTAPLADFPIGENQSLPPPESLKYKILIKAKKKSSPKLEIALSVESAKADFVEEMSKHRETLEQAREKLQDAVQQIGIANGTVRDVIDKVVDVAQGKLEECDPWKGFFEEMTDEQKENQIQPTAEEQTTEQLAEIVNYLEAEKPPHHWTMDGRNHILCSLEETKANPILNDRHTAHQFLKYTTKKLVRIYPSGFRVRSDNYNPLPQWIAGAQLVALNFQTECLEMFINNTLFEANGGSGYVLKPECLRDPSLKFEARSSQSVQHQMPIDFNITIYSANSLSLHRSHSNACRSRVSVTVMEPPYDSSSSRTITTDDVAENGLYSHFGTQLMAFEKIRLPEMSFVLLKMEEKTSGSANFVAVGYRLLCLETLVNGFRHITLRTFSNKHLGPAAIFALINVHFHVQDLRKDLHRGLVDPMWKAEQDQLMKMQLADPFGENLGADGLESKPSYSSLQMQIIDGLPTVTVDDNPPISPRQDKVKKKNSVVQKIWKFVKK